MKYGIVLSLLLVLTGCEYTLSERITGVSSREVLRNEQGYAISDCHGSLIGKKSAHEFWRDNNLPRGTTSYICKDYKAYLPNKVCSGTLIPQSSISGTIS